MGRGSSPPSLGSTGSQLVGRAPPLGLGSYSPRFLSKENLFRRQLHGLGGDLSATHGLWTKDERALHINILELRATRFALGCFARDLTGENVLLRVDNVTALAYINKQGGLQSDALQTESRLFGSGVREGDSGSSPPTSSQLTTSWQIGLPVLAPRTQNGN